MTDIFKVSITLFIALLTSLYYYKNLRPNWVKFFPWTLILWLIGQFAGLEYFVYTHKSNHLIFNLYLLPEYGFYFFLFYKIFLEKKFKLITLILSFVFLIVYCYEIFWLNNFYSFSSITDNVGQLSILLLCFFYLGDLFTAEELINYFKLPFFWITTGIMIYCIGNFIYTCFLDYILKNNLDPDGDVYFLITFVITNIQYGLFTVGFLCFNK